MYLWIQKIIYVFSRQSGKYGIFFWIIEKERYLKDYSQRTLLISSYQPYYLLHTSWRYLWIDAVHGIWHVPIFYKTLYSPQEKGLSPGTLFAFVFFYQRTSGFLQDTSFQPTSAKNLWLHAFARFWYQTSKNHAAIRNKPSVRIRILPDIFLAGMTAIIQKWLNNSCRESEAELLHLLTQQSLFSQQILSLLL